MHNNSILESKSFSRKVWILFRYLHTATSPDARWGAVSVLLSFAFFFFGFALAFLTIYLSDTEVVAMLVLTVIFTIIGFGFFAWGLWMGWHFWHSYSVPPVLIVTNDEVTYDTKKASFKDNQLVITTDEYEIRVVKKEEHTSDKPASNL